MDNAIVVLFNSTLLKLKRHFYSLPKPEKEKFERLMYGVVDNTNKDKIFLTTGNSLLRFHILFTCVKEAPIYEHTSFPYTDLSQSVNDINTFLRQHEK